MIVIINNKFKLKRKKKTPAYKQLRIWSAVATGQSKQLLQPLVFEIIPRVMWLQQWLYDSPLWLQQLLIIQTRRIQVETNIQRKVFDFICLKRVHMAKCFTGCLKIID